jgi:hypothetical protein
MTTLKGYLVSIEAIAEEGYDITQDLSHYVRSDGLHPPLLSVPVEGNDDLWVSVVNKKSDLTTWIKDRLGRYDPLLPQHVSTLLLDTVSELYDDAELLYSYYSGHFNVLTMHVTWTPVFEDGTTGEKKEDSLSGFYSDTVTWPDVKTSGVFDNIPLAVYTKGLEYLTSCVDTVGDPVRQFLSLDGTVSKGILHLCDACDVINVFDHHPEWAWVPLEEACTIVQNTMEQHIRTLWELEEGDHDSITVQRAKRHAQLTVDWVKAVISVPTEEEKNA